MADSREQPELETYEPKGVPILAADVNGKLLGEKELRALNEHINKQPNQNLMIIEEIEGLMSQVNDKLNELRTEYENKPLRLLGNQALEEIDLFQKTTLFELRKAFE